MIENTLETYEEEYVEEVLKGGFHKTPVAICMTDEYIQWSGTASYRLWEFLRNSVIRGKLRKDPMRLYTKHYLKGRLVTSWSERKLEEKLSSQRRNIRKYLKELEDKGFIEIEKDINPYENKLQNIYVMGSVIITGLNTVETFFAYKRIWQNAHSNVEKAVSNSISEFFDEDIKFNF